MIAERIMAWAIPVFFALIAVELLVARWRGHRAYRCNDAMSSLALGTLSQITGVFVRLFGFGIYALCAEHLALFTLPAGSAWTWLLALLLYDFTYYWVHRCGHRINLMWAAHAVHHQSEDYNLTTALRQPSTGWLVSWIFYLPMAVLGVPTGVFVVVGLIDLLYQFWVHTGEIGRLGWFDRVFCSPSNHRAHHAVNERYLDKNYGGILIVWDRLFGSFVEEDAAEPPVFGTRSPLRSWNPLWANAEVYWAIWQDARRARRWRDRLRVWIKPPGWRPVDVAERFPKPAFDIAHARFDPPVPVVVRVYALAQFALLLGMAVHFLGVAGQIGWPLALAYAGYLTFGFCVLGALLEGRRAGWWLEAARTLCTAVLPWLLGPWFGVPVLPPALALAFLVVYGASAALLPWLARSASGRAALPAAFEPEHAGEERRAA